MHIAREAERRAITGVPPSTRYELQRVGQAPKPIPLGRKSVGWLVEELEEWIARRAQQRKPLPIDDAVNALENINDRNTLLNLLRVPANLSEDDKLRVGAALAKATARLWK